MRITRVKINNYRCIRNLEFFPAEHNIIVGPVNAGKSTLLNALALTLDPDIGRRYKPIDELDFFEGKTLNGDDTPVPLQIEVTLVCEDLEERNYFIEEIELWDTENQRTIEDAGNISVFDDSKNIFAVRISFEAKYDAKEKEIVYRWYYPKYSSNDPREQKICSRTDREKAGFFLIPAERNVNKALSFTRYSALDKALRADKILLDEQLRKIVEQARGAGNHLFDNQDFERLIKEIERQVETMLALDPSVSRKLTFELSELGHYEVMNILKAFVSPQGASRPYPVTNQGMGARQIITLATLRMLAVRKGSCIVAVEEPEISLHPNMQRSLVSELVKSHCQTFMTTHSVHVAQAVDQEYLYLMTGDRGEISIRPTWPSTANGLTGESIKALRRMRAAYPSDFLDCLFSGRVLLVEGQSDREALPVLIRKISANTEHFLDLDSLGIGILPCTSKSEISKIAPYFNYLGKPVYSLCDSEKGSVSEDTKIENKCDASLFWPKQHAIEKVLLSKISKETATNYISEMEGMEETYFKDSGTSNKDLEGQKADISNFLKKRSAHRHLAEFIPYNEISELISNITEKLNHICSGEYNSSNANPDEKAHS